MVIKDAFRIGSNSNDNGILYTFQINTSGVSIESSTKRKFTI